MSRLRFGEGMSLATFPTFLLLFLMQTSAHAASFQFLGWRSLQPHVTEGSFQERSWEISIPGDWQEGTQWIPSWNVKGIGEHDLSIDVELVFEDGHQSSYSFGHWNRQAQKRGEQGSRTSVNGQNDAYGAVHTDTLILKKTAHVARWTLGSAVQSLSEPQLKLFGVCVGRPGSEPSPSPLLPSDDGWSVEVPPLCQFDYLGGKVWCSPTSVTMIMQYWSKMKGMDSWHYAVPETSAKVFDPGWPGTGNWSFNVAHAGGHDGLRSWVCRLASLDSLIHLLRLGVPVAASVSYDLLKGKATKGDNDGHLVVVSGWDQSQHVIVNDPAKCPMVRTKYPVNAFMRGWNASHRTVYIILPNGLNMPEELTEIQWMDSAS